MAEPLTHLSEVRSLALLRRAELDPVLTERVLPIFLRGLYSAAILQAMLEVEVRVRELSGLSLERRGLDETGISGTTPGTVGGPQRPRGGP
jgi:hypothetical protein